MRKRTNEEKAAITEWRCPDCNEVKPVGDFFMARNSPTGYSPYCKPCSAIRRVKYVDNHRKRTGPVTELVCSSCREVKPVSEFYKNRSSPSGYQSYCKPCISRINQKNLDLRRPARRAWERKYLAENPEKAIEKRLKYRDKLKREIYEAYGGFNCACCGITEPVFLTVDHIDGGGNKHFKQIGGPHMFYKWLRKNSFPPGFQILCRNCNWAKSHGGCPHKQNK